MAVEESADGSTASKALDQPAGHVDGAGSESSLMEDGTSDAVGERLGESKPGSATDSNASGDTMTITFKLYATLQDLLPRGAVKNAVNIEVATDTTLYQIIDRFKVPRELAHLVLVNGVFFCDADRNEKGLLKPGDVLAIWPPVAGG